MVRAKGEQYVGTLSRVSSHAYENGARHQSSPYQVLSVSKVKLKEQAASMGHCEIERVFWQPSKVQLNHAARDTKLKTSFGSGPEMLAHVSSPYFALENNTN